MEPEQGRAKGHLGKDDLIPDARLRERKQDAFRHLPIAARVAELAVQADTPVNIALFGPWGSGKSSFVELLRAELRDRDKGIQVVRYDAWKYGGGALKRNFISSAATELGLKADDERGRKFHRGLYENKRTVQFDPLQLIEKGQLKRWFAVFAFALAFATVAIALLAIWIGIFSDKDVSDEIARLAPGAGARIGGFVLAVGAALNILDGAKVEVEQVVPSEDEQFADLFRELVTEVTKKQMVGTTTRRLVFFIDELDRCSKEDVVSTLTSLRTFLDQDDCVFVVAADREVLEEALDAVEQATPVSETEPYYSSASAFLDKIFQHQFALPPLRGGRLTGFARELVIDRGGLWKTLREDQNLDGVLYTLIPSHVRAPRRVKVLLNNFATNARVSESRGIDWRSRAEEIAKLTVLQTEYPRLAADLYEEPRLPTLLLDPADAITDRQKPLVDRHRLTEPDPSAEATDVDPPADTDEQYEPPDRLLAAASPALLHRQREELHRYLQSRSGTPDPGRDLLYLEPAGDWVGLDDAELNRLIEDEAATRPERVVEALVGRPVADRLAAARLLGHLSEQEFGPERNNMITALAGVLSTAEPDELADLGDLLANVASFQAAQPLDPRQLPGLLVLAIAGEDRGRDLARTVHAAPQLLATPDSLALVARLLPKLNDAHATPVAEAVAERYVSSPELLLEPVGSQPAESVARLLGDASDVLVDVLRPAPAITDEGDDGEALPPEPAGPDAETVTELTERLLSAVDERGGELLDAKADLIVSLLHGDVATYPPCRARGADVAVALDDPSRRNDLLLDGINFGPAADWRSWSEQLLAQPEPRTDTRAERALMAVVRFAPKESAEVQASTVDTIQDILRADPHLRTDQSGSTDHLVPVITEHLAARSWWESDADLGVQMLLYRIASILAEHLEDVTAPLTAALIEDLHRPEPGVHPWDEEVARRVADLVGAAPELLAADAQGFAAAAGAPALLARLRIAQMLVGIGEAPLPLDTTEVVAQAGSGSANADSYGAIWLSLDPPVDEVVALAKTVNRPQTSTASELARWARDRDQTEMGTMFLTLVDADVDRAWLSHLVAGVDNTSVLDGLAVRMKTAGGPKRDALVKAVTTLTLTAHSERQAVGQMALDLLSDSNQARAEAAAELVGFLGSERYGLKQQIKDAVSAAADADKLGDRARKRFQGLGLLPKRKKRKILGLPTPWDE